MLPQCPDGFTDAQTFCFNVSEKSSFPPKCPFDDVVPFIVYKDIIVEKKLGPVWMPARRNATGFLQWTELTSFYKSVPTDNFQIFGDIVKKNCLLYYNDSYIVAVSCDDQHPGVCAYYKLVQSSNQLCGRNFCFESDYDAKNKCFCVDNSGGLERQQSRAEFIKMYQNVVYGMLTNRSCTIGLEKTQDGNYIWARSKQKIIDSYWSADADFDSGFSYGAATPKGWILTLSPLSCNVVEEELEDLELSLHLVLDDTDQSFYLNVSGLDNVKKSGDDFLIFCFTDAHPSELLYRYFPLNATYDNQNIFRFVPLDYGPGSYWCESFKYSDSTIVLSDVIFFRKKKLSELVATFSLKYEDDNVWGPNTVYTTIQTFLVDNNFVKSGITPRIMKIQQLDDDNRMLINVHFSSENQYGFLQTSLVDFLNSDYCLAVSDKLTWPETPIGSTTFPEEFCFFSDGSRQSRFCGGNFVDGARWLPVNTNCNIPEKSDVSDELLSLFACNSSMEVIGAICNITTKYEQLNSFDIYLIGKLLENVQIYLTNLLLVEMVFQIINNLLYVDKNTLTESQREMKATDILLRFINTFLNSSMSSDFTITKPNFVLASSKPTNIRGMIVQNEGKTGFAATTLTTRSTIKQMLTQQQLECLLWISPKLRQQLKGDDKITLMIYYNDVFFDNALTKVFNLQFSNNIEHFDGAVTVAYRVTKNDSIDTFCAFWENGSWIKDNQVHEVEDFQICEFWRSGSFAIIATPVDKDDNVTSDLNDVLSSNYTADEVMQKLSNISERFDEFKSEDVFLFGKVLDKVGVSKEEVDLDVLARVVNQALKIDEDVLKESQTESKATDLILYNIDEIVKNSRSDQFLTIKENFAVFSVDVKVTNFSGLVVVDDGGSARIDILTEGVNIDSVVDLNSTYGAVLISSELKAQMVEDSKIVITIFLRNVFFNDLLVADVVFGVLLPEIEHYSGPVSIYHHNYGTNGAKCVYWYYDIFTNIRGFWKEDGISESTLSSIKCDFWHTTHLGLVLLEDDKYDDKFDLMWLINLVDGCLSIIGFCGIVLTAVLFEKWRSNTGNQILLNFVLSIVIQLSAFYSFIHVGKESRKYELCVAIGAIFHYAILAQFSWMFVIGILQFKRFVIVLGSTPKYLLLKACLFGWGLPLVFVSGVLIFDQDSYVNSNINFCYPSGLGLALGVWLPIAITLIFNLCVFIYILYSVCYTKNVTSTQILHQWRLAILLFFLLGITWIFGLLANLKSGIVFLYLFNFTANLQGLVVFLYFIVFNANTRSLYINAFKRCFRRGY